MIPAAYRTFAATVLCLSFSMAAWSQTGAQPLVLDIDSVGRRDINSGDTNSTAIEKEMVLGHQLAAEIDRRTTLVEDQTVLEFVNRLGQNLVLNSDAVIPVTFKVVDSTEINAWSVPGFVGVQNRGQTTD